MISNKKPAVHYGGNQSVPKAIPIDAGAYRIQMHQKNHTLPEVDYQPANNMQFNANGYGIAQNFA